MPTFAQAIAGLDGKAIGEDLHRLVTELFPICRSITGPGVRETLARIGERVPLEVHEVPTGTPAFDWEVPREWTIRDAWIKGPDGNKIVDFEHSNLHVVSYSAPVRTTVSLAELTSHVHTLPDRPQWIPYRTSYYRDDWGFCMSHDQLTGLVEGDYEVCVDATLADGALTYGEHVVRGQTDDEVLVSCHICHPSLANDNLSSVAVTTAVARTLESIEPRYTYRFVYGPGTVGAIVWLARNEERVGRIAHGLIAANLGDAGSYHYKRSRRGDAVIDRAVLTTLRDSGEPHEVMDFVPFGYDERQYCSPGFNLPVGSLTRTPHGQYPEYHTSADNPDLVRPESLAESVLRYLRVFEVLEGNRTYRNLNPKCEPQLGRRGLYRLVGGGDDGRDVELALLWVLNMSDGGASLLDIAERSGMSFPVIRKAADALLERELLAEVE